MGRNAIVESRSCHTRDGANCSRTYSGDARGRFLESCLHGISAGARISGDEAIENTHSREFASAAREHGIEYALENTSAVPSTVAVRVLRTWWMFDAGEQIYADQFASAGSQTMPSFAIPAAAVAGASRRAVAACGLRAAGGVDAGVRGRGPGAAEGGGAVAGAPP